MEHGDVGPSRVGESNIPQCYIPPKMIDPGAFSRQGVDPRLAIDNGEDICGSSGGLGDGDGLGGDLGEGLGGNENGKDDAGQEGCVSSNFDFSCQRWELRRIGMEGRRQGRSGRAWEMRTHVTTVPGLSISPSEYMRMPCQKARP